MTVPERGVERLMHFIDQRRGAMRMSLTDAANRGMPSPKALRDAAFHGATLRVRTLRRIDDALAWEPGSAAATLVGATPVSTAVTGAARATSGDEALALMIAAIANDLRRAREAADDLRARLEHAEQTYTLLIADLRPRHAQDPTPSSLSD